MAKIKGILSRRRDGTYLLTRYPPIYHRIAGTREFEFYCRPGEPIGVCFLCAAGIKAIFDIDIPIGTSVEVWVDGGERCK